MTGPTGLTDAELVAILLRTGTKGKDALFSARELVARFGGLRGLLSSGWKDLAEIRGMGEAKIASLLVVSEISKRSLREEIIGKCIVRDPSSVMDYLYCSMRDKRREMFKVLFLNKANQILSDEDLFEGTVDETAIYVRELVRSAIEKSATSLILCHNHPSGRTYPSQEDLKITRRIQAACEPIGIKILDHIIVGDNQFFSFSEKGLLQTSASNL